MDKKKLVEVIEDSKKILREHPLCDHCLGRIFAEKLKIASHQKLGQKIRSKIKHRLPKSCYICKNLMLTLGVHIDKMIDISKEYQFTTFLIGAILQPSIHDKDDSIRSKFKLRGITSIKSEVTREMGKLFSRKTRTSVDYQNPDVVFTIDFKKNQCALKSKTVFLQGRYTKKLRTLPQKQKPCERCYGKGCFVCDFHGIAEYNSIEGRIVMFLIEKFGAQQAKITWIGSEDQSSLVIGNGRPFFVKLVNPHKRYLTLAKKIELDGVTIHGMRTIYKIPSEPLRFRTEVSVEVEAENNVTSQMLSELQKIKSQFITLFENSGHQNKKRIFSIKLKQRSDNSFKILMKADGGIPIKRFISGYEVEPSVSSMLGVNCTCKLFDFHKIIVTR